MAKHDFTEEYRTLWQSGVGKDLLDSLEALRQSTIIDAEKAESMERGYGLLNQAAGVMLAITHLKGKAVVPRTRRNGGD